MFYNTKLWYRKFWLGEILGSRVFLPASNPGSDTYQLREPQQVSEPLSALLSSKRD